MRTRAGALNLLVINTMLEDGGTITGLCSRKCSRLHFMHASTSHKCACWHHPRSRGHRDGPVHELRVAQGQETGALLNAPLIHLGHTTHHQDQDKQGHVYKSRERALLCAVLCLQASMFALGTSCWEDPWTPSEGVLLSKRGSAVVHALPNPVVAATPDLGVPTSTTQLSPPFPTTPTPIDHPSPSPLACREPGLCGQPCPQRCSDGAMVQIHSHR